MHKNRILPAYIYTELPDRLQEWKRLNVTNCPPDLGNHDIVVLGKPANRTLYLVRDVWNHLYGRSEIVTTSLFRDDVLIDPAGRDIIVLRQRLINEPLVVT